MQTSCQTKLIHFCLECFDLFVNQTQENIYSQEAAAEEFSLNRFYKPQRPYLFYDDGIFSRKALFIFCVYTLF